MDFLAALDRLSAYLDNQGHRWALAGALALCR
jgi:hypothetical protein